MSELLRSNKTLRTPPPKTFSPKVQATEEQVEQLNQTFNLNKSPSVSSPSFPSTSQEVQSTSGKDNQAKLSASPISSQATIFPNLTQRRKLRSNTEYQAVEGLKKNSPRKLLSKIKDLADKIETTPSLLARVTNFFSPNKRNKKDEELISIIPGTSLTSLIEENPTDGDSLKQDNPNTVFGSETEQTTNISATKVHPPLCESVSQTAAGTGKRFQIEETSSLEPAIGNSQEYQATGGATGGSTRADSPESSKCSPGSSDVDSGSEEDRTDGDNDEDVFPETDRINNPIRVSRKQPVDFSTGTAARKLHFARINSGSKEKAEIHPENKFAIQSGPPRPRPSYKTNGGITRLPGEYTDSVPAIISQRTHESGELHNEIKKDIGHWNSDTRDCDTVAQTVQLSTKPSVSQYDHRTYQEGAPSGTTKFQAFAVIETQREPATNTLSTSDTNRPDKFSTVATTTTIAENGGAEATGRNWVQTPTTTKPSLETKKPCTTATKQRSARELAGTSCGAVDPTFTIYPGKDQQTPDSRLNFNTLRSTLTMDRINSTPNPATLFDLDEFQNNQHTLSRLQLLPIFDGGHLTRFDSWLESFESIVDGSGWSEEKTIQMLRAKLTERAFSVMQTIIKNYPHDYQSIKNQLLDYFHGDENAELYQKKFSKAKRKPGEKIIDYAHRIKEIFRRAYPNGYSEKTFAVILMQKFIEGLDSTLQQKIKYKTFKHYHDLVAATRIYAQRIEAMETDREKNEFVRAVDQQSESEIKELKQMLLEQKEIVKSAVASIRQGNKVQEEPKTETDEIKEVLSDLAKAVKELQGWKVDGVTSYYQKQMPLQKQVTFNQPTSQQNRNGNRPNRQYNNGNNQQFTNNPNGHVAFAPKYPQNQPVNQQAPNFAAPQRQQNYSATPPMICTFCGRRGHLQEQCFHFQRQTLENSKPPICFYCREIGHIAPHCPKPKVQARANIPGPPQQQGNQ